jgi:restriction endonuclease Mrr
MNTATWAGRMRTLAAQRHLPKSRRNKALNFLREPLNVTRKTFPHRSDARRSNIAADHLGLDAADTMKPVTSNTSNRPKHMKQRKRMKADAAYRNIVCASNKRGIWSAADRSGKIFTTSFVCVVRVFKHSTIVGKALSLTGFPNGT